MPTSKKPKNTGTISSSGIRKRKKGRVVEPIKDYREYLIESLKDPLEAAEYLNAALQDDDLRVFLLALRTVAEARGIGNMALKSKLNRESTYRMLSEKGNPQLSSLSALLDALDLRLAIEPKGARA